MRARMAIAYAHITVEIREVVLRDKPEALLKASEKGTVPALCLGAGSVIDESLDIMLWALTKRDTVHWMPRDTQTQAQALQLITDNDTLFKPVLDRYKYASRFPEFNTIENEQRCDDWLDSLNQRLKTNHFLLSNTVSIADIALFPFIRQFANTDFNHFHEKGFSELNEWLETCLNLPCFKKSMEKYPRWSPMDEPLYFGM
jgi:glutathione S-transferase